MKEFRDYLHPEFLKQIEALSQKGFEISLVGGTTRDFFLGKENKHDYDCEVRFGKELNWKELSLEGHIHEEALPYDIKRFRFKEFECEFSMPRVESFIEGNASHKNFLAEFDPCLSIFKSAVRRDFTINAIYMTFNEGDFVLSDPLLGKKDIESKVLSPCSDDFYRDPVRILRAFRFQTVLNFSLRPDVVNLIKKYSFHFSPFYARYEAEKSLDIITFLRNYNNIFLPVKWNPLIDEIEKTILDTQELKNLVFLSEDQKETIKDLFGFSDKFFPSVHLPSSFKGFENFEHFLRAFPNDSQFKKICQLDDWAIEFLNSKDLIDLNLKELKFLQSFKIDLRGVHQSQRSAYRIFQGVNQLD